MGECCRGCAYEFEAGENTDYGRIGQPCCCRHADRPATGTTDGPARGMISVAVRGYGVVIWRDATDWKAYGRSDRQGATLADRTEQALRGVSGGSVDEVRDALMAIAGAQLLADRREG